jgi:hypothetical protein
MFLVPTFVANLDERTFNLLPLMPNPEADPDRGIRYLHGKFPAAEAWQISAKGKAQKSPRISLLVPTLRVGMHTETSATSLPTHSHAERGNEVVWLNLAPFGSDP